MCRYQRYSAFRFRKVYHNLNDHLQLNTYGSSCMLILCSLSGLFLTLLSTSFELPYNFLCYLIPLPPYLSLCFLLTDSSPVLHSCSSSCVCLGAARLTKIDMEEDTGYMDSGDDMPGPVSSPRRKRLVIDEQRACVQMTFDELKEQHKNKYSGPQYRPWAEALVSESHNSRDDLPMRTMFKKQSNLMVTGHSKVKLKQAKCTATPTISSHLHPPRHLKCQAHHL